MRTKHVLILFVLIEVLFIGSSTFAQLSPYQGIINPYERYGGLGGSFGGVIIAEPDVVPSPLDNPAGIAFQRAPQVFAGSTTRLSKYDYKYWHSTITESRPWEAEFAPIQLAVSYPFTMLKKETTLALSAGNIPAPEIETGYTIKEDDLPDIHHNRSGNVGNVTIGYSIKTTPSLSIGLSYTRWLGNWEWEDYGLPDPVIEGSYNHGKGKFQYNGNSFNFGMNKQIQRFAIGILVQSPFTLMKGRDITLQVWEYKTSIAVEQKVNGAAAIGVSYRLSDYAKLGIGYRYQDKLKMVIKNFYDTEIENSIDIHKLSVAGEYTVKWNSTAIPVYLAWQHSWLKENSENALGYLITTAGKKDQIQNSVQLGLNWSFKSLGIHLAAIWQQYQNDIQIRNSQIPPYS
ncbi:MAG TPA: hypothetical protein PLP19_01905 [bacterium]|nr:hypothetical protein [bacterium]HPN42221.1 hypothetical protein [bacterium]